MHDLVQPRWRNPAHQGGLRGDGRAYEALGEAQHPRNFPAGSPEAGFISYGHARVAPFDPETAKFAALDMVQ